MTLVVGALIIAVIAAIVTVVSLHSRRQSAQKADSYLVGGAAYLDLMQPGVRGQPYALSELPLAAAGRQLNSQFQRN